MANKENTPVVLAYGTPKPAEQVRRSWHHYVFRTAVWAFGLSIAYCLFLGLLDFLVAVPDAVFQPAIPVFIISLLTLVFSMAFGMIRDYRNSPWNDEHDEVSWDRCEYARKQLLAAANGHMNLAPSGKWRVTEVAPTPAFSTIAAHAKSVGERMIEFLDDGTGRYYVLLGGVRFETIFAYKPGKQPFNIHVRTISPPGDDAWHLVEFGYTVFRDGEGAPRLRIWFESDCPLPPDQVECWPFWGELPQVNEPSDIGGE